MRIVNVALKKDQGIRATVESLASTLKPVKKIVGKASEILIYLLYYETGVDLSRIVLFAIFGVKLSGKIISNNKMLLYITVPKL